MYPPPYATAFANTHYRFIAQKAHDHGPELSFILPQLYERGTVSSGALQSSEKWQALLNDPFDHIANSDATSEDLTKVYYCNALLNTTGVLAVNDQNTRRILGDLERLLRRALATTDTPRQIDHFAVGVGLQFFVEKSSDHDLLTELWPALCQAASYYGRSLSFWRALLVVSKRDKARLSLEGSHMDILRRSLIRCLSSPSHDLRLTAIYIIVELVASKSEEVRHIISVAMLIEQTPLTLEHQRSIGMRVGQLAKLYPSISSDDWMGEAIPTFCFGLLHYRLASVWDNSCSALKVMCNVKEGEGYVTRLAVEWLAATESDDSIGIADASTNTPPRPYVNEFECTNIVELEERVSTIATQAENVEDQLDAMFKRQHEQLPLINLFSRTQALKLLNTLPQIAEKRNASLVPILLSWALDEPFAPLQDDNEEEFPIENASPDSQSRWNRKDQKEMLALFAKFVNPKVLFRSDDVREALLALLSNGDIEIQKAALQALLAWKNSAVSAYKDELLGLLDDARFREELPAFLGEGKIQIDHVDSVLPLVLRLLYGRVIAGKRGLESKRKSVFVGLMNRFGDAAIHQFLAIAFGRLKGISVLDDEDVLSIKVDARKQVGLLNMLESLSSTLEASFAPFVETSIDPILYCVIKASRDVASSTATEPSQGEASDGPRLKIAMLRSIRQRGIQLLSRLVENSPEFGWQAYTDVIVTELIEPRLELLPIESAQSVSAFLRLFAAWSKSSHTAPFLVEKNILAKIIDCLEVPSAKDEVKKFVLDDILRNLVLLVGDSDIDSQTTLRSKLIEPYSHAILSSVGNVLRQSPSKEVLESGVLMVADLAPHVVGSTNSRSMIEISTFLLRQPSKRVNSHTKLGLLKILHAFIQQYEDVPELFDNIFDAICPTFAFVQDRIARSLLCQIIDDLSKSREELVEIAVLCRDLNSFSSSRLDEPDFERRSLAYNKINSEGYQRFSLTQFKPLVWSMLHFIKDNDELSIRTSASLSLRRFIEVSASSASEFRDFIAASILPGIEHGMREPSELVRTEYLAVLEQLVKVHSDWALLADLHVLTGSADSEGEDSFFGNVLHIQSHRRLRALRRLATHASQIGSRNIYHIILPLLEQFVFQKADDESADGLSGETIKTLTSLCECLEWPQLRALTKRYIGYLTVDGKQELQKQTIKLIGGLMDGLNRAAKAKGYVTVAATTKQDVDLEAQVNGGTDAMDVDTPVSSLTKTLPQQEKLTKDVIDNLLPKLVEFLHKKDDTTVSLRVPVAVAIVKVLMVLPPAEIEARLPAILLDIAYILKSRAQESRDMARNTLSEIVLFMGASYLGFVLKSLRTALQRGYQLHVLSFVLHAILVKLQPQPGDLDYCLAEIVDVVMDDTFGITGQEKDAEEYVSTMKEVKSSKSFDSMDIVARSATPSHLIKLIIPIKSLLLERLNSKMVQKIDELLRRIGLGLLQNPTMHSRDVLVFCYEMIQEVYMASATSEKKSKVDPKSRRYLITMRGAAKSGARLSTATYTFKLIRFSLDILRTVLRQNTELQTPQNLAGFLPVS
jgi:U3 small nucleolar RNA-associated protein 20